MADTHPLKILSSTYHFYLCPTGQNHARVWSPLEVAMYPAEIRLSIAEEEKEDGGCPGSSVVQGCLVYAVPWVQSPEPHAHKRGQILEVS